MTKNHWENVYSTKAITAVSWFQEQATQSLALIKETKLNTAAQIIDIGGGASILIDDLLGAGYENITVLDISGAAITAAQARLGNRALRVQWWENNILDATFPAHTYDIWHDRAVFHFLVTPEERTAYIQQLRHALKPNGFVIIATFAEDGPTKCSGLPVRRYSVNELSAEFGASFSLLRHKLEEHRTPTGNIQQFIYCLLRRRDE